MNRRTLSLKRETLTDLSSADLRAVAGGASVSPTCYTCLVTNCAGVCNTEITDYFIRDTYICPQTRGNDA